jgi:hypothetical protein
MFDLLESLCRETLWTEDPLCHYTAYIYTPLACDFALASNPSG